MRPIRSLIDTKYLTKARFVDSLTNSVRSRLSPEIRNHCWVTDVIDNCLIMVTDHAERATRLRYQQHELLKQINEEFTLTLNKPIKRLKIKVDYKLASLATNHHSTGKYKRNNAEIYKKKCAELLRLLR